MTSSNREPVVFLVDDDASIRTAMRRGLVAAGFAVRTFESADSFLAAHDPDVPGCLVADVAMPGMNGLELQSVLAARGNARPIIFVTARGSIPMSVQAMRAGAVTFLSKPVRLGDLLAAVLEALERDRQRRRVDAQRNDVENRLMALTTREREVLELIIVGRLNKQIAAELGAAEKTIKVHRGRVMAKLQVRSVAELVTLTSPLVKRPDSRPAAG
jgi:FixJ family two-component response regulator